MRHHLSRGSRRAWKAGLDPAIHTPHSEEAAPALSREDLMASRLRVAKVLPFQQASPPFMSNLALATATGLLLVFAFPEWNLWSLAWVGTAPLIMALARERRLGRGFLLGLAAGAVFYAGSSHWITYSMHNYGGLPLWLSYLALALFAALLATFTGLFGLALVAAVRQFGGWALLAAPLIWPATEWLRLQTTGMGWNALGYSQAFKPLVIQTARLGGVYIVSAMLITVSTALVFAVIYLERRRGLIVLTAGGILVILAVLYGQSLRPYEARSGSLTVGVVQPNIPVDGPWGDDRFEEQMMARFLHLSRQALSDGDRLAEMAPASDGEAAGPRGVSLILWPESPMPFIYDRDPALQQRLSEFTRRHRTALLMNSWGFPKESADNEIVYNSALLIGPDGTKISQYDKIALMPFGEYVPARRWIPFMDRIPALVGDVTAGETFLLNDVAGARIGNLICFEATRPDLSRRLRNDGATAIAQLSNESWFGPSAAARQVLAHTIFRAVENNIEIIRATNSGLSARIDAFGMTHDETPLFETATRVWRVKTVEEARSDSVTFYTRYGDIFAVACAIASLLLFGASLFPKRDGERPWSVRMGESWRRAAFALWRKKDQNQR